MKNRRVHLALSLSILLLSSVGAESSVITFFGEDANPDPDARLLSHPNADAAREDFLSYLDAGTDPLGPSHTLNFGAEGTGNLLVGNLVHLTSGTLGNGLYPISGDYFAVGQGTSTVPSLQVLLNPPVVAFGFYGIDIGPENGQLRVRSEGPLGATFDVPHSMGGPSGSVFFWGLISTDPSQTIIRLTFFNVGSSSDIFGFDDLTIGSIKQVSPAPEPGTLSLLGFFLSGAWVLRGRVGARRMSRRA